MPAAVVSLRPSDPPAAREFRAFVEAHRERVYYLALDLTGQHADAEDVAQDVFVKAHRARSGFRGEADAATWLYRITVNTFLNRRRSKIRRLRELVGRFDEDALAAPPEQDDHAAAAVAAGHVRRALGALSPRERTAFVLRFQHERSVAETAAAMDVAEGTVKSLCHRATQKLRRALDFYRDELGC